MYQPGGRNEIQGKAFCVNRRIENKSPKARVFRGEGCSITVQTDSRLEPSVMYRNIWVKSLKREDIIGLRRYKGYLQTAALICGRDEHEELSQKLVKAGIRKISDGFEMSSYALGETHDGVFPLREYSRVVSVQVRSTFNCFSQPAPLPARS